MQGKGNKFHENSRKLKNGWLEWMVIVDEYCYNLGRIVSYFGGWVDIDIDLVVTSSSMYNPCHV